ncbi:serine protease [Kibdelosporangium lantanae]
MRLAAVVAAVFFVACAPLASADVTPNVVGGTRVSIEDYRFTVYLVDQTGFQFCGGSLVAADKVVTAAHCTQGRNPATTWVVWDREDKQSTRGKVTQTSDIWIHPRFTSSTRGYDVSVVTLATRLPGPYVPLATPRDTALYAPNTFTTVLGWGAVSSGGSASRYLLAASVPITTDAACRTAYGASYIPSAMVCAGYQRGGVDTCQGDSGGPLLAGGKLIGDTSWGRGARWPDIPGCTAGSPRTTTTSPLRWWERR